MLKFFFRVFSQVDLIMAKREREKKEMEKIQRLQEECKASVKLEKIAKNITESKGLRSLTFTMQGDKLCLLGSDVDINALQKLSEDDPDLVTNMMHPIKTILQAPSNQKKIGFKTTRRVRLPKLSCQFKGKHWTEVKARAYGQLGLLLNGFGQGGEKSYSLEFIPVWWPDWIDFESYQGSTKATKEQNEAILENMYSSQNLDISSYHKRSDSPARTKKILRVAEQVNEQTEREVLEDSNGNDRDSQGEEEGELQHQRFFKKQTNFKKKEQVDKKLEESFEVPLSNESNESNESGEVTFSQKGYKNVSCTDTENEEDIVETQTKKRKTNEKNNFVFD